jgi:hypothetical protein
VLSLELARRLRDAGLTWTPGSGDRFVVADRGMDGEVFVLSEMTVDVHELPEGRVIGFNGTTEWALDSVEQEHTVWLPREDQLRELLGGTFRSFARTGRGWAVHLEVTGEAHTAEHADAEEAYGLALMYLLDRTR